MYIAKNTIHFIPGEFITTEKEKYIGEKEELQTIVEGKKLFVNIEPIAIYRDKEQELQNKRILEYRYCTNEKTDYENKKYIIANENGTFKKTILAFSGAYSRKTFSRETFRNKSTVHSSRIVYSCRH